MRDENGRTAFHQGENYRGVQSESFNWNEARQYGYTPQQMHRWQERFGPYQEMTSPETSRRTDSTFAQRMVEFYRSKEQQINGGGAKRGPKTDPAAPHNAKIHAEAERLISEGNTIIAGGGGKEALIPTPGGMKDGRRPDIIYQPQGGGPPAGINVGKTRSDGTPVKRESEALSDLNGPGGLPTTFIPYY